MPIPLKLCNNFFEQVAECFDEGFRQTVCRSIGHRELMLGKLELLAQASHEAVEEWLTVVGDDVPRYTISPDNVCPNEVNDFLFFTSLNGIASAHLEK